MPRKRQKDNQSFYSKLLVRQRIRAGLTDDARVLEGFVGDGRLGRSAWAGLTGVCIDTDRHRVTEVAKTRPAWACYEVDTELALLYGLVPQPFDVVDLDPDGSPWKYVKAWMVSDRVYASTTEVVLTDGYIGQMSLGKMHDKALYPDRKKDEIVTITVSSYLETIRTRLAEWGRVNGLSIDQFTTTTSRRMAIHHLRVAHPGSPA